MIPAPGWRSMYNSEPTYDTVLGALVHTSAERQGLLRPFFEPTEEDRAAQRKVPSPAHRAVAELVAGGHIRVVLTTNFDFLAEHSLRGVGIEPVVASSPEAIVGLAPLHLLGPGRCVVVHLHGDYLSDVFLNTADELGEYPPETNDFLSRVFDEYGLIIVGWSGRSGLGPSQCHLADARPPVFHLLGGPGAANRCGKAGGCAPVRDCRD